MTIDRVYCTLCDERIEEGDDIVCLNAEWAHADCREEDEVEEVEG